MNISTSFTTSTVAQPAVDSSSGETSTAKPESAPDREPTAPAAPQASTTVTLSPAAQAAQEAAETPQQTAREARGNDQQARQLVAKQAALEKMYAAK